MSADRSSDAVVLTAEPTAVSTGSRCKLCDGPAVTSFTIPVREVFQGVYERCTECGSLQVQNPVWIREAYEGALGEEDTGAAQRALYDQMVVSWLFRILHLPPAAVLLDYGGGEGLLVRLLRDIGIDARFLDRHGSGAFAQGFRHRTEDKPEIVTSFEVWEHFVDPLDAIGEIFQMQPRYVFISTRLYRGEDADWWYLAPTSGQHVFFYTNEAMQRIAQRFGYHVYVFKGAYALFSRSPLGRWQRRGLNLILTHKLQSFLLAAMPFYSGRSLERTDSLEAGK